MLGLCSAQLVAWCYPLFLSFLHAQPVYPSFTLSSGRTKLQKTEKLSRKHKDLAAVFNSIVWASEKKTEQRGGKPVTKVFRFCKLCDASYVRTHLQAALEKKPDLDVEAERRRLVASIPSLARTKLIASQVVS